MRALLWTVLTAAALACLAAAPGCTTQAEKDFTVADVRIVGQYLAKAQPAVEAYCTALEADPAQKTAAAQLRLDTQTLAAQIAKDQQSRLDKLSANAQLTAAAQGALDVAKAVLEAVTKKGDPANGTSQPASP